METLVFIPAFNESANIATVITEVRRVLPYAPIVVIDDGSSDGTARIARQNGAVVLKLPFNLGIGAAVQTGLRFAVRQNVTYAVRLDGDGQHNPGQIPLLLDPVRRGDIDIAIGSRFCDGACPPPVSLSRRLGIRLFCGMTSAITGQPVTDPTSGFMALNLAVANFLSKNLAQDYPEVDARILLHRAGFRVREYPVEMRPRQGGKSSITPMRSCYYAFKVSLSVLAARSRWLAP